MSVPEAPRPIPSQFIAPEDPDPEALAAAIAAHPAGRALPDTDAPERDEEAVDATPTTAPPRPDAPPRIPIAAGTYAIYDDGGGGLVMVAKTSDGETHHKHVNARMIKMAQTLMGGANPLAALFGGG